jgi:hypothetical protein
VSAINDIYDPFYCHTRFSNIGSHDDLSCVPTSGLENDLLILGRKTRM